jgi:hypothetical protein
MTKWVLYAIIILTIAYFGLSAIKQLKEIGQHRLDYYEQLLQLDERN